MLKYLSAMALCAVAAPALAGGWTGGAEGTASYPLCSDLAARGTPVVAGQSCIDANGNLVVTANDVGFMQTQVLEVGRNGILCPYPYRPSDSVFVNGSGYLIKDAVRARLGCL
ncbi:hypothetical protein ILP92_14365 [Maribius pontilimi]|uniref:Uncharacterized protein n=1 Tax=Palleronia pontilimi TaxID=1964209 RepID=A0A934IJ85_9RHOB|nr:hypothetical protein [Palleronia pontilimi]MBJ3763933.1 hypothetical protein [Palleronia pontilimi]